MKKKPKGKLGEFDRGYWVGYKEGYKKHNEKIILDRVFNEIEASCYKSFNGMTMTINTYQKLKKRMYSTMQK